MNVEQYDRIQLISGETGYVVEVLEKNKAFIVDVERNNDYDNEIVFYDHVKKIIKKHSAKNL